MIFDAHCDIWTHVARKRLEGERDIMRNYHLNKFKESDINGGIFVVWVDPPYDKNPKYRTTQILSKIKEEIKDCDDIVHIVKKSEDFDIAKKSNKIAILIGMEGLQAIDDNIDDVEKLYSFGVRHASLTWNEENKLATGAKGNIDRGLTEDGAKLIKKMEELGMIIDVSHLSDGGFEDVFSHSKRPFIASHSNAREILNHPRNLTDEMIRKIAEKGGVIGLNFGGEFLQKTGRSTVEAMLPHIRHIQNVGGHEVLAIGTDFDGVEEDMEIRGCQDMPYLIQALERHGLSASEIGGICYENAEKFLKRYWEN